MNYCAKHPNKPRHAEVFGLLSRELTALSQALLDVEEGLFQGKSAVDHPARHGREVQKIDLIQQSLFSLTLTLNNLSHQALISSTPDLMAACRDIPLSDMARRLAYGVSDGLVRRTRNAGEPEFF